MKIFILGMPQSGRTTVAKALCMAEDYRYIDAYSWIRSMFREIKPGEKEGLYEDEYHNWFINRLKLKPEMIIDSVHDAMNAYNQDEKNIFVIDGIRSPRDFLKLFDYNKDVVIFLNRTGNQAEYRDYEDVGLSAIRDCCFWMAATELLPKERWLEYNFSIPGEDSEFVKLLCHKNSVFIVRSINRVISHLKEKLKEIQ